MGQDVELLVGCEDGLYRLRSNDAGKSWSAPEITVPEVESFVLRRAEDGTLYLGTRGEGLLRRTGDSERWEAIETPSNARQVRSICPTRDGLLIGTEAELREGGAPASVFEWSPESGWRQLGDLSMCSGSKEWFYPTPTEGVHVRWLSVDPRDPDRLYAAVQVGGIAVSTDHGRTWTDRRDLDSLDVHMVQPHPDTPGLLYAGAGGRTSGFYRSRDGGDSWEVLAKDCGSFVLEFAFNPTNPRSLYLGASQGHAREWRDPDVGRARGEVFRSDDGGDNWRKLGNGLPELLESRISTLFVDPQDPHAVYFGAGFPTSARIPGEVHDAGVYQSLDGGDSWRQIMPLTSGEPMCLTTVWKSN